MSTSARAAGLVAESLPTPTMTPQRCGPSAGFLRCRASGYIAAMHLSRILVLVGAVVAAASLPLDAVRSPTSQNWSMIVADAWPAVVITAIIAVFAVAGQIAEGFTPSGTVISMVLAASAALLTVAKYIDAVKAIDVLQLRGHTASIGAGMWVLAAGIAVVIAGSLWSTSRRLH